MKVCGTISILREENGLNVSIERDGNTVGYIFLEEDFNDNEYTIIDAFIHPECKGNGLYSQSILKIIKEMPKIKINSILRSPEADRVWVSLFNRFSKNGCKIKCDKQNEHHYQIYRK